MRLLLEEDFCYWKTVSQHFLCEGPQALRNWCFVRKRSRWEELKCGVWELGVGLLLCVCLLQCVCECTVCLRLSWEDIGALFWEDSFITHGFLGLSDHTRDTREYLRKLMLLGMGRVLERRRGESKSFLCLLPLA